MRCGQWRSFVVLLLALARRDVASGDTSVPRSAAETAAAPQSFSIEYLNYGLRPPTGCDYGFRIRVEPSGTIVCGWVGGCPHEERRQPRPKLTSAQLSQLATLTVKSGFFKLDDFNFNEHIIDGTMEVLKVHLGRRAKTVEMANTGARAFKLVGEALFNMSGCSMHLD